MKLLFAIILFAGCSAFPIFASQLQGFVRDPSAAFISGATISLKPSGATTVTDSGGHFLFDNLNAGEYTITVKRDGFQPFEQKVTVADGPATALAIELKIATQEATIEITGRRSALANSNPVYKALRDDAPGEAYRVENIELKRDQGTITLKSGQIVFLKPVMNRTVTAVFVGDGRFQFQPFIPMEQDYLNKITGRADVDEAFESAVLYFTDATFEEVKKQGSVVPAESKAADVLKTLRSHLRRDVERPRSMLESLLSREDIPNLEAQVLGELLNPQEAGSFRAYIHGKHFSDLRFLVVPSGAMPMLPSPEEVGVLNFDPGGDKDGIWYLSHYATEWKSQLANNAEDKRVVQMNHYRIETAISKGGGVAAIADLKFTALDNGARMIHFGLLPSLRVTRVTSEKGAEVAFIQEPYKENGSFHVIMPEGMAKGKNYLLRIEYQGGRMIANAGNGNFAVDARTCWYPSVNSFLDRATYDLTFKVPKAYTLVGTGTLVREDKEGDFAVTQWKSDVPLAVAGFNFGLFRKKGTTDAVTKYQVDAYTTRDVPDSLAQFSETTLSPSSMADRAVIDGQNSMRVFTNWFGPAPYGRIAITQQPQFSFGQSWPTLVYLPISAFLDSTQRWMLMGASSFKFGEFIQEVTPHEVSHQWWGHMVGWASYHDQWLSEGFADFSAGIFLEATEKPDQVNRFWDRLRDAIIQKNNFGNSANDAGPLYFGLRLNSAKTAGAYNRLVYSKGAYILQMLRMMMRDDKTGDADFIAMMKDYVQSFLHKNATTEGFASAVAKHMKPALDVDGTKSPGWFFYDWVYSSNMPKYRLEYTLTPAEGGKVLFTGKLTQSDVTPTFLMRVPVYFDFDGHIGRGLSVRISGSKTIPDIKLLLPKKPKRVLLNANHDILASEIVVKEM